MDVVGRDKKINTTPRNIKQAGERGDRREREKGREGSDEEETSDRLIGRERGG